jgi:SAM-dependent methyltransferase
MMSPEASSRVPPESGWSLEDLEQVGACLLCGSSSSRPIYEGLTDRNFFAAPGTWTLLECAQCGLARLDPRPSREALGGAYVSYYTHRVSPSLPPPGFRQALTYGYLNVRYRYAFSPAFRAGACVLPVMPLRRGRVLRRIRHLPRPPGAPRLLDIGCGDGGFLVEMRRGGWAVEGIDVDPVAARLARDRGLDVREGMFPGLELESARFDAVTLSHVLEHLHDPVAALREIDRILKPGGTLYIATPNLRSSGHRRFGRDWLHLDPPRHLTIFDAETLRLALDLCGFVVRDVGPDHLTGWTYAASAAVAAGVDPFDTRFVPSPGIRLRARVAAVRALIQRGTAEELAVTAVKPPFPRTT